MSSPQYSPFFSKVQSGQSGAGFGSFLKKANNFAKKTQIISKGLKLAGDVSGIDSLKTAGKVAGTVGYGKKKSVKKGKGWTDVKKGGCKCKK